MRKERGREWGKSERVSGGRERKSEGSERVSGGRERKSERVSEE